MVATGLERLAGAPSLGTGLTAMVTVFILFMRRSRQVIHRTAFRRLQIVPGRRHAADKYRTITAMFQIWMQPSHQQRNIAPQLVGTRRLACSKHPIAVTLRCK